MAKQWLRIPASQVVVGDMVNLGSSMNPSERFHRVTEVTRTPPKVPVPGAKACTVLITCGKQARCHTPEDAILNVKR